MLKALFLWTEANKLLFLNGVSNTYTNSFSFGLQKSQRPWHYSLTSFAFHLNTFESFGECVLTNLGSPLTCAWFVFWLIQNFQTLWSMENSLQEVPFPGWPRQTIRSWKLLSSQATIYLPVSWVKSSFLLRHFISIDTPITFTDIFNGFLTVLSLNFFSEILTGSREQVKTWTVLCHTVNCLKRSYKVQN